MLQDRFHSASPDHESLRIPAPPRPAHTFSHPVVIVGAGPVGLALAVDLAQTGVETVLLDDDDRLSTGSRAICFSKRTLEIFDRLGCAEPMVAKGVGWRRGRVFHREGEVYGFDLQPESGHSRPAFINLQQYYVEGFLYERARTLPTLDMRFKHRVVGVRPHPRGATVEVEAPDGGYQLEARYLVAADGARSFVRGALGLESRGQSFRDRFLIADVRMEAAFPAERWFWFDPPFHPGQSVLLHKQADDVWRVDFQLGPDADPAVEREPERIGARVRALLGPDACFELVWASVYSFACTRMARFRHGPVLFAGDSAHGVSPFGARGANSGVQDADNLGWKLRAVLADEAPDSLLDSYADERERAADENILNSTRSTDFISPKSEVSRHFRDATLELARDCAFARPLVNSGRLSRPAVYSESALTTPDEDAFAGAAVPGGALPDAPLPDGGWLLRQTGDGFTLLCAPGASMPRDIVAPVRVVWLEADGLAAERLDARGGAVYLIRPDQHVAARWRRFEAAKVEAARARALGKRC